MPSTPAPPWEAAPPLWVALAEGLGKPVVLLVALFTSASLLLNRLTLATFRRQKQQGRKPFPYQIALVHNDVRFLIIGGLLLVYLLGPHLDKFWWIDPTDGIYKASGIYKVANPFIGIFFNTWMVLAVAGAVLNNNGLLMAASLDRHRSLASVRANYFASKAYADATRRRIRLIGLASYAAVFVAFLLEDEWFTLDDGGWPTVWGSAGRPSCVFRFRFEGRLSQSVLALTGASWLGSCVLGLLFLRTYARTARRQAKVAAARAAGGGRRQARSRQQQTMATERRVALILALELAVNFLSIAALPLDMACWGGYLEPMGLLFDRLFDAEEPRHYFLCTITERVLFMLNALATQSNFLFFFTLSPSFRRDLWKVVRRRQ